MTEVKWTLSVSIEEIIAMNRVQAVVGSTYFLVVAPGTAAGLVPWAVTDWQFSPPLLGIGLTRWIGIGFIAAAVSPLAACFARFALQGRGTPAPFLPPARLVVDGLFRYVRNPMYCAVLVILLGESLLFADLRLVAWTALFGLGCHLFVLYFEEPVLARKFGKEYDRYRANVPRWRPRIVPWAETYEGKPAP
jgi:protein-S-isoprenylcysteine O-methyltransferase Ste14